jgi:hypothetical protein
MKQRSGANRSARIAVRLSPEDHKRIEEGAKGQDYASPSAFICAAIRNELNGRAELTGTEERIAAGFDRMSQRSRGLERVNKRSLPWWTPS